MKTAYLIVGLICFAVGAQYESDSFLPGLRKESTQEAWWDGKPVRETVYVVEPSRDWRKCVWARHFYIVAAFLGLMALQSRNSKN